MANSSLSAGAYLKGLFQKDQDQQYLCTIIGMPAAGKTHLIYRLHGRGYIRPFVSSSMRVETEIVPVPSERVDLTVRDLGGGCHRIPTVMVRGFQGPNTVFLYVIDASEPSAAREDLQEMSRDLMGLEAKYVAVVFNKRDLIPHDDPGLLQLISKTKHTVDLLKHDLDCPCELYEDLDELSAVTGAHTDILLTRLARACKAKAKQVSKSSIKEQTAPDPNPPKPSSEELLQNIVNNSKYRNSRLDPDGFMRRMVSGELDVWDHQSHLRAGYLTLTECILKESVVFNATDLFLERLDQMLTAAPQKFRNTSFHRTLTTFWLYQVYLAMLSFREQNGSFPPRDKFNAFLVEYPDLTYGRAWDIYYTKDLLFSPEARDNWRLPDLEPLPQFVSRSDKIEDTEKAGPITPAGNAEILKRYAYAILKTVKLKNRRRAAVINLTLPIIQSHIMRLRTRLRGAVEPYSETQAYFWIQMVHAAVDSLPTNSQIDITETGFESFKKMFPDLLVTDDVWKEYYAPEQWNSIEARMQTVLPKRKPLPNVWRTPGSDLVEEAISSTLDEKYSPKASMASRYARPSMEELSVEVRCAVDEMSKLNPGDITPPDTHARLIYRIFNRLVETDTQKNEKGVYSLPKAASDAVSFLREEKKVTLAGFWSEIVLGTFSWMDEPFHERVAELQVQDNHAEDQSLRIQLFLQFLSTSPELSWDGLWKLYYSDEVWKSEDASRGYVLPDKQSLPAHAGKKNNEKAELGLGDWEWVDG